MVRRCRPKNSKKCKRARVLLNASTQQRRRSVSSLFRISQDNQTRIAEDGQIRQGEST